MNMAILPAPLPTPPNSTKTKVEHTFDEQPQYSEHAPDAPLFDQSRRESSPTDFLFPHREGRQTSASPTARSVYSPESIKRSRSDDQGREDDRSRKSMRFSRSPSPHSQPKDDSQRNLRESYSAISPKQSLPVAPITPISMPAQPIEPTPRYTGLSESERDLVTSFTKQFSKKVVDYGTEKWFTVKRDSATNTWIQPSFEILPRPSKSFTPINGYSLKPKSTQGLVSSVELSPRESLSPKKKQPKAAKPNRKRSSTPSVNGATNGKSEARSTRNPANKPLSSKNYKDYPDYSPRAGPSSPESVKLARNITQMSGSKDLSSDPLRHELSEAELIAAQKAGMDCARYLCTKRAVFVGFVKHLRYIAGKYELSPEDIKKGLKSWNKTAAQGCSGIDVNKTSALWAGLWQPMGWFDKDLFKSLIQQEEVYFPKFDKDGNVVPQYDRNGNLMH